MEAASRKGHRPPNNQSRNLKGHSLKSRERTKRKAKDSISRLVDPFRVVTYRLKQEERGKTPLGNIPDRMVVTRSCRGRNKTQGIRHKRPESPLRATKKREGSN